MGKLIHTCIKGELLSDLLLKSRQPCRVFNYQVRIRPVFIQEDTITPVKIVEKRQGGKTVQAPNEQAQYEKQINKLREALRRSRDLRSGALKEKELREQELDKLRQKAAEYGITPEELGARIASLKEELDRLLSEADRLIPWELLEKEQPR